MAPQELLHSPDITPALENQLNDCVSSAGGNGGRVALTLRPAAHFDAGLGGRKLQAQLQSISLQAWHAETLTSAHAAPDTFLSMGVVMSATAALDWTARLSGTTAATLAGEAEAMVAGAASATRRGSSGSTGMTLPPGMLQNVQCRVQISPNSMNVAVRLLKHSPRLGQLALSHTVFSEEVRNRRLTSL